MTMSQNVPLPKNTMLRIPKIQQGLIDGHNYEQIAEVCGVTEKTIDRDMQAWVESGLFEVWLKTEFAKLYSHVKISNPVAAYKELAKIVAKMVTQKREITEQIEVEEHVKIDISGLSDVDKSKIDAAARLLESQSKRESSGLH